MTETYEINGKQYTKQEVEDALGDFRNAFGFILDTFSKVVKGVADIIKKAVSLINDHYKKKEHDYNWHVPLDTTRLSQVRVPNVKLPRIRNLI